MLTVRFLDSTTRQFDQTVLGWLLDQLPDANRLSVGTAYYEARILDWMEEPLEELIARGGSARFVVGSNSGITRTEDLERLLRIVEPGHPDSWLAVEYYDDAIFHPKVFVVETDDHVRAVVGSANMTANGSLLNIEAGVEVATDQVGPPPEAPLDEMLASLEGRAGAIPVTSAADLSRLEGLGVIGRARVLTPAPAPARAQAQRTQRRATGIGLAGAVGGIPARTRRPPARPPARRTPPPGGRPPAAAPAPAPAPAPVGPTIVAMEFSRNDLKSTGTREFSVSRGMREWAESVLGRTLVPGEGDLFNVTIMGRLALTPSRVFETPQPQRIWAAGGSGGTHTDVRQVIGNPLKTDLDDESTRQTGTELTQGSIGVFELPANPASDPVRLTIFTPSDPNHAAVDALLRRTPPARKREFVGPVPQVPRWPY